MARGYRAWPALVLLAALALPRNGMAEEQQPPAEPEWLVLQIDTVRVAAQRPASAGTWDGEKEKRDSGAGCDLLSLAAGVVSGGTAGTATNLLCRMASADGGQAEKDPRAPDLLIKVAGDAQTIYRTYIAQDTYSHMFMYSFVVPVASIPRAGLHIILVDQDGDNIGEGELIGSVRLPRAKLVGAATGESPVLTLNDGPLEKLELTVSPYAGKVRTIPHSHAVTDDLATLPSLTIHAGEVVELQATGSYSVANNGHLLGPAGYPDGLKRSYNLPGPAFAPIAHGAAVASMGDRGARTSFAVDGCVTITSAFTGSLQVGVNDDARSNNQGELRFVATVRPPRPDEWSRAGVLVTCAEAQAAAPRPPSPEPTATTPPEPPQKAPQSAPMEWAQARPAMKACAAKHRFRGTAELVVDIDGAGKGTLFSLAADGATVHFVSCMAEIVGGLRFDPAHGSRVTYSVQFE